MRALLLKITELAQKNLLSCEEAKNYLLKRCVTLDQMDKYQIGYFSRLPKVKELSEDHKKWNGFASKGHREMITFPLYDLEGKMCGFHIRTLKAKLYDKFFLKNSNFVFYGGLSALKCCYENNSGILVEGIFDLISISKYLPNSLALLTVNMSSKQRKIAHRYFKRVFLGLDSDGRAETENTLDILREELEGMGMTVQDKPMLYKDSNQYQMDDPLGFYTYCQEVISLMKE